MSEDVTATDVGQHWLKLEVIFVPDIDKGEMIRRFIKTFANLYAAENGEMVTGVIGPDIEEKAKPND